MLVENFMLPFPVFGNHYSAHMQNVSVNNSTIFNKGALIQPLPCTLLPILSQFHHQLINNIWIIANPIQPIQQSLFHLKQTMRKYRHPQIWLHPLVWIFRSYIFRFIWNTLEIRREKRMSIGASSNASEHFSGGMFDGNEGFPSGGLVNTQHFQVIHFFSPILNFNIPPLFIKATGDQCIQCTACRT